MVMSAAGGAAMSAGQNAGAALGGAVGGALGASIGGSLATAGISALMSALGAGSGRADADVPYMFFIEIGGLQCVRFTEASGLQMVTEVEEIREGGNNRFKTALIKAQTYKPLIIKKGFFASGSEFFQWMGRVHDPTTPHIRQSASLVILNDKGDEVGRYNMYNAFPTSYDGPTFSADAKTIAFEKLTIRYDFFEFHPGNAVEGLLGAAVQTGTAALNSLF